MVLHDLAFLHFPGYNKPSHLAFYKKHTPKYLAKATIVATVSQFSKQDILAHYAVDEKKIDVVYSAAKNIFKPVSETVREEIKNSYTEGKEFFLYTGAIHPRKNLLNLLKAFSVFKKRQKSNTKLVLAGRLAWKYDSFVESLKNYKYRQDVVMLGYVDEQALVNITGSAYALVYPSLWEGFGVPVLEAMQCGVPVITSSSSAMHEIGADAALYADADNFENIAEQMMRIYKDENLRKELIEKGRTIATHYSWERTAGLLWNSIVKAVS